MKIALAQINTSPGNIEANAARVRRFLAESRKAGADLTVFPELTLTGYSPRDLLEQEGFVEAVEEALSALIAEHPDQAFVVGSVVRGAPTGKGRYNAAIAAEGGSIKAVQHKRLLPEYDIFDERRYFDPGGASVPVEMCGASLGLTVCEDIWVGDTVSGMYAEDPASDLAAAGAGIITNLSASPFHAGKDEIRKRLAVSIASRFGLPTVLVNLVGGNDEIIFDGGSFATDRTGRVIARAAVFEEDLCLVDMSAGKGELRDRPASLEEWLVQALELGLRDYVRKCGFRDVLVGLSGGVDSSLVAALAVRALGPGRVTGVFMPSPFTSPISGEDARALAANLGIRMLTISINAVMESYRIALEEVFRGRKEDETEENIQARIRGNLIMALSNKFGSLVLSCGNKSELAVGYCTQYGDMVGGLGVLADLPKTKVYDLVRYLNRGREIIPRRTIEREPTAELRLDQKDEDSLPPYTILDPILRLFVEDRLRPESIVSRGFDEALVNRVVTLVERNEFKRRQTAPGLRLSGKAFGSGRRMPIARGPA